MAFLATAIGSALTWAGERVLTWAESALLSAMKNKAAHRELAELTAEAMTVAVGAAPELAEDLQSASFLQDVVAPIVIDRLRSPALAIAPDQLSRQYIDHFVEPWVRQGDRATTLARVFSSDESRIEAVMLAFVETLRQALFASHHWKDVGRDRTIEETHAKVSELVELQQRSPPPEGLSIATARADAVLASQDLLDWQRTIGGLFIERPELDQLLTRIAEEPRGRTLLVGEAGAGKSALLSELTERLHAQGVVVFGLKADMLPAEIASQADLAQALGLQAELETELSLLAAVGPVVLIIDQLDAVSSVMDRSSQRMKLLMRVASAFQRDARFEAGPPVHVLISSRPFEASHDARFQSLGGKTVNLTLPVIARVEEVLTALEIEAAAIPEGLRETLRRPFALKLFVDLVRRGVDVRNAGRGELLSEWLRTADLGDGLQRPRVLSFLERLALAMTETETLWRPADTFDIESGDAVTVAEATGLIIRQEGRIGFSHQSWLDDFQAKGFHTGADVAAFAWARQDGLFARATVLRALERLRRIETQAYEAALRLLLGEAKTRRHLRHLVVDLIANQAEPTPGEQAWVQHLLRTDFPLARRAAGPIARAWTGWRSALLPQLPEILRTPDLKWTVIGFLEAEGQADGSSAIDVLETEWSSVEADLDYFEAARSAKLWDDRVAKRMSAILSRHEMAEFAIGGYLQDLTEAGRIAAAAEVLEIYIAKASLPTRRRLRLRGLDALVEAAPSQVAQTLIGWFVELLSGDHEEPAVRAQYPHAASLPFDWDRDEDEKTIFGALRGALAKVALEAPSALTAMLKQVMETEVDEAQALVADTYGQNPAGLAPEALAFLLGDPRRLWVGVAHLEDETGCGHMVTGYSSQQLITAIAPHLNHAQLGQLNSAIERWDRYRPDAWDDWGPEDRRLRRGWTKEARLELLVLLPERLFDTRTNRRHREWRATRPVLRRGSSMAHFVGAPMSSVQMAKASDDAIMGLLDECHDETEWGDRELQRRHISRSGGAVQVGREFAELAKTQPDRVLKLVRERLSSDRHQHAAGNALQALSGMEDVPPETLIALIRALVARGFTNDDWIRSAAGALHALAQRQDGLGPEELALLESWIVDDPAVIADRMQRRLALDASNRARNPEKPEGARPVIFGRGFGGGMIVPQGNYTILSALGVGVLSRSPPDCDLWRTILERHLERPEDPQVWEVLLLFYGKYLFWADRPATHTLFTRLWARFPEAFMRHAMGRLWSYRSMIPAEVQVAVLQDSIDGEHPRTAQAAGEFAVAAMLVGEDHALDGLAHQILEGPATNARLGGLFAASAAWRQNAGRIRSAAHAVLMAAAATAEDEEAEAIATALDGQKSLLADPQTQALFRAAMANPAIFSRCLSANMLDGLQGLLVHPGFDDLVSDVLELAVATAIREGGGRVGGVTMDSDLVGLAVALQRSEGQMRTRAMNLYERLLDAEVYGASEAAAAVLRS